MPKSLFLAGLVVGLVLVFAPDGAAQITGGSGPPLRPSTPFQWGPAQSDLGPVVVPAATPSHGWVQVGSQMQWRIVPPQAGDLTFEVYLYPPHTGHPTKPERFLLQVPKVPPRALVVGFHPYGVSEKSIFLHTSLPQICATEGWMLLAPAGMSDTNFANLDSQTALDKIAELVASLFPFNEKRAYTVGFSMGGLNAVSYAMRHLDPDGPLRIAGVVYHTGTADLFYAHSQATAPGKAKIEAALGGTPTAVPFEYERISPYVLQNGASSTADLERSPLRSIENLPFYVHLNLNDPNADLIVQVFKMVNLLTTLNANFKTETVQAGGIHSWSTLDMRDAMDWVSQYDLPPAPLDFDLFADRQAQYHYVDVLAMDAPNDHGRVRVRIQVASNAFALEASRNLGRVAFETRAMGLDPSQPLAIMRTSGDGTSDELVLRDYTAAPAVVLVNGGPPLSSTWDALTGELTIVPTAAGALEIVQVFP